MFKNVILMTFLALLTACAQSDNEASAADAGQQAADGAAAIADDAAAVAEDIAASAGVDIEALVAAADPDAGKRFYIFCQACHTLNAGGMNKVGPNLHNIVGSPAAQVEGFVYSDALTSAGITWDAASLDAWLERPSEYVPGTTMIFSGIPDQEQRAALIAFLQQAGSE